MALCLGIETSCDETGLALVEGSVLRGQSLSSQADIHALFGGVVPEIASREHYRLLPLLLDDLFVKSGHVQQDVEVVAVARGPGLLGSLLVGLGFAKAFSMGLGAALVGVDHLHAHLLAPGLNERMIFPALGLLVSGGHTHLYHMRSEFEFELLGRTLDDAAGEVFDKVAKMLNLPYPGGRFIDEFGRGAEPDQHLFPRPYLDNRNLDFSFSGLKTAVAEYLAGRKHLAFEKMPNAHELETKVSGEMSELCASFNYSVAETLRIKTSRALERAGEVKAVVLAGGVAANHVVRKSFERLAEQAGLKLFMPPLDLCTDNAAMVAFAGERLYHAGFRHGLGLEAIPRGRKVPWDYVCEGDLTGKH